MKKASKAIAFAMASAMAVSMAACGGSASSTASGAASGDSASATGNGSYDQITYAYATFNNIPTEEDLDVVEEEINKITREKIGAEITLKPISIADYVNKVSLSLQGGEKIDVYQSLGNFGNCVSTDMCYDISDLIDSCAPETKALLGDKFLDACKVNGKLYGIPTYKPFALTPMFIYRKDIADELGIDMSTVNSVEDVTPKYGITVWRDHDHMHAHNPDSIFTGVIKYLGWENYYIPSEKSSIKVPMGYLFELPETTVKELGQYLEDKLAMNGLRIVGNPEDKIRKVAIVGHLFPGFGTQSETREYGTDLINAMEQGLDAIIPGEVIEWTVLSYVRDALALGRKKAVFNIGHFNMEKLGMRYARDWIGDLVDHMSKKPTPKSEQIARPCHGWKHQFC